MDSDVLNKTTEELQEEVRKWRALVRAHRGERGHNRCWFDDIELYKNLPEGLPEEIQKIFALPDFEEWKKACAVFCLDYWCHRQPPAAQKQEEENK